MEVENLTQRTSGSTSKSSQLKTQIEDSKETRRALINLSFHCFVHPIRWNNKTGQLESSKLKFRWSVLILVRLMTLLHTISLSLNIWISWMRGQFELNSLYNLYILIATATLWICEVYHINNICRTDLLAFCYNVVYKYFDDFESKFLTDGFRLA